MAFDVKKWLKEDMGFSDAEVGELAPKLEAKADVLEKGQLRQADYSKHMNALKVEQDKLDKANENLNAEMVALATVQADGGKVTAKMREDLQKAEQDVLKLTHTVRKVATDAGLDPEEVLKGTAVVVPVVAPVAPDLTGYLKSEDFNKHAQQLANIALTLPAELMAIAQEHFDLTGQRLDTRTIVAEIQTRAGSRNNQKSLNPREIWEETHKIPDVRATKSKTEFDAAIKAAEDRGREAERSQQQIPGSHTPEGRHSIVFMREHKSAVERPQPGTTVGAAVAALRSHKYREQPAQKTA